MIHTEILDFEALDDILILAGIVIIFITGNLIYGGIPIGLGLLIMVGKGELTKVPKPQNQKDYEQTDTGADNDYESSDDDSDDGGDDGDGDADD